MQAEVHHTILIPHFPEPLVPQSHYEIPYSVARNPKTGCNLICHQNFPIELESVTSSRKPIPTAKLFERGLRRFLPLILEQSDCPRFLGVHRQFTPKNLYILFLAIIYDHTHFGYI
ncbi:hypothetical protein J6590_067198 [Homalodisca vitripennis]|nr:hypothetical protein J6590_067198 [Homalodisca vitripennis]